MKRIFFIVLVFLLIAGCNQVVNPVDTTEIVTGETAVVVEEKTSEVETGVTEIPEVTSEPTAKPTDDPTSLFFRPELEITNNLFFVEGVTLRQKLDLYLPPAETADQTFPIMMLFHAGGVGTWQMTGLALKLVDMGFSVVSVDYTPKAPKKYEDGACAVGWIYENAEEYGFDLEHLYLLGQSAGGSVAAFLGTVDDFTPYTAICPDFTPEEASIKGVIIYTGFFDYTTVGKVEDSRLMDYIVEHMGVDYATGSDIWWENSPIAHVDGSEPEFVLFHGDWDTVIFPSQSYDFAAALENVGVKVTLNIIDGVDHYGLLSSVPAYRLLTEYLLESIQ